MTASADANGAEARDLAALRPTERFTDRVADYQRYRPGYPASLTDLLHAVTGLTSAAVVADIGSGTGLLTRELLEAGHQVFAVEPNAPMRAAAEAALSTRAGFTSVAGTAEATTLPDSCAALITAGQAFHWFDPARSALEFRRIGAPGAWAAMIWNERPVRSLAEGSPATPFMDAYDELLVAHCPDYPVAKIPAGPDTALQTLFGGPYARHDLPNAQTLDREGLKGRVRSSSYVPPPHAPGHDALMRALDALFDRFAEHGYVTIPYTTQVFVGRLG
jgi:SAM-dependent methyltransferase